MSELNISDKFLDFLKNRINEHVDIVNNYSYNEEKLNKALEKLQVETTIYANLVTIYTNSKTQEITDEIINSMKNVDADTINNAISQLSNFTNKN
jgi:formate dehydrogenase maturation protein FdhE